MITIPGLRASNVGQPIKLQIFERESENSETLLEESLKIYVGRLVGFFQDKDEVVLFLEERRPLSIKHKTHYLEVYAEPRTMTL